LQKQVLTPFTGRAEHFPVFYVEPLAGNEAASMVREQRSDVKLLFMSGYPNRGAAGEEVMLENSQFLQKPVDPSHLARVLRKELDTPDQRNQTLSKSPNEPEVIENAPSQ